MSDEFYNAPRDDPKSIIKWCEDEIKEYKKLIKIIKKDSHKKDKACKKDCTKCDNLMC